MLDLVSTTEELHYENYRQQQMETRKFGEPKLKKLDNPKFKEEEEQLRKRFTEQVKAEETRFRQWEQHVRFFFDQVLFMLSNFLTYNTAYSSLLQNVTASTRTSRWRTALSSSWKQSWTRFKSHMAAPQDDDERVVYGRIFFLCYGLPHTTKPRCISHKITSVGRLGTLLSIHHPFF